MICGRPAVYRSPDGSIRTGDDHTLCPRCFRATCDAVRRGLAWNHRPHVVVDDDEGDGGA